NVGVIDSKRAKSVTTPHFEWIVRSAKRYISFAYGFRWRRGVNNGDRSSANRIVVRGALPHDRSIRYPDSGRLAVCGIFLLSVQKDGVRLVLPVRRGHGFGRSGRHLQARSFLSARARDSAQRRSRIGAQRDRAWPRTAQILCAAFILRLSDRHRRHRDLGLWGPVGRSDVLNPPRASLLQCIRPLLARSGHANISALCPLCGVKRTSLISAFDLKADKRQGPAKSALCQKRIHAVQHVLADPLREVRAARPISVQPPP